VNGKPLEVTDVTDNHTSTLSLNFYRPDALPRTVVWASGRLFLMPKQQSQSTEGKAVVIIDDREFCFLTGPVPTMGIAADLHISLALPSTHSTRDMFPPSGSTVGAVIGSTSLQWGFGGHAPSGVQGLVRG